MPSSIQHRRSANHTLRIVCPNGHLGFAPIKTGSFRIGCESEPDLICADSGSCDVGPVPLGADISSSPRQSQVDDLEEYCSSLMPEIVADSPSSPVITCFSGLEIKNIKHLVLISSRLAGATRAGGSPREAQGSRPGGWPSDDISWRWCFSGFVPCAHGSAHRPSTTCVDHTPRRNQRGSQPVTWPRTHKIATRATVTQRRQIVVELVTPGL